MGLPREIAVMYSPGHQRGEDPISKRNNWEDATAKEISHKEATILLLLPLVAPMPPKLLAYTYQDLWRIHTCTNAYTEKG